MTCEQCRQQLLPYLYDLLDADERDQAAAHLQNCPVCQEALQTARQQQGMLAEAVKEEHADIVFKAPSKATPASLAPTIAMQRPARRIFLFNRWAAAAAILLMLFGAGSVIGWTTWRDKTESLLSATSRLAKAKQDLTKSQEELNQKKGQTQEEIRAIQDQIDKLFDNWKQEESKTRKVLEGQGAKLTIKGPQNPVAGANNPYQVEVRQDAATNTAMQQQFNNFKGNAKNQDQKNLPGVAQNSLNVRLINQKTQQPIFSQGVQILQNNEANFVLPPDLPIKPGEEILLEFQVPGADGKLITLTDNLKLAFPEYVTHLATDRPLYRPGETVRFRSLTLERFSLKPAQQKFHLRYRIVDANDVELFNSEAASTVVTPAKQSIKGPKGEELHCLGTGEFTLPANLDAGTYTLIVSEVNERFNEEKRAFQVKPAQPARFTKELQFHRSSYGAGDQVKMKARVVPLKGQPIGAGASIKVTAHAIVDGERVYQQDGNTDADGRIAFEFSLPNQVRKEAATVILECGDGSDKENLVRELPLVVRDMQVEFFPEGGDLIAGAPCRVYFQARTPANRIAEFIGRIVDEKDQEVARIQTASDDKEPGFNRGLGSFTFTPQLKKQYKLRIDSPIGVERAIPLPEVRAQGVVLHLPQGVAENAIDVRLQNVGKERDLLIGVYCRGRMVDTRSVKNVGAGQSMRVLLKPMAGVGGVYRITVFEWTKVDDENVFRHLAERLIYRKSPEKLDVKITSDRDRYLPGDPVRLNLEARNEKNVLSPALAMVAVVDGSLLKRADEKTGRGLPTHFLLTTEIRSPEDIENADVLLSSDPKAPQALDLLLGCQGWRRFAEQNPQKFQVRNQQAKQPVFLANTAVVTQFLDTEQKQIDKLDQGFVKKVIEKQKELSEAEKQEAAPAELAKTVEANQDNVQQVSEQVAQTERRVRELRALLIQFGLGGALVVLLFISFYLISIGMRNLSEGAGTVRPWLIAGIGLFGILVLASVVGTFAFMGQNLIDDQPVDNRPAKKPAAPAALAPKIEPPLNLREQGEIVAEPDAVMEKLKIRRDKDDAGKKLDDQNDKKAMQPQPVHNKQLDATNVRNEIVLANADAQDDRQLRQKGEYQTLLLKQLGRRVLLPAVNDPCVVREYAHRYKPPVDDGQRDFAQSLYWHPVKVLVNGKAGVDFDLPDTVGQFQVLVQSHTFDGRLGSNRIDITSALPFRIEPGVPDEVSNNDQIVIPVAIENARPRQAALALSALGKDMKVINKADRKLALSEKLSVRELFLVKPVISEGIAAVRVAGSLERSGTVFEHRFKVVPDGFPAGGSIGGVLENGAAEHVIVLPENMVPGSLNVQAYLYPSVLAELQGALDALSREPAALAVQKVANHALNKLILESMKQHAAQANPFLEKRVRKALLELSDDADMESGKADAQGRDRDIETTSLALLGWLKAERAELNADIQNAVKRLHQERRGPGSFGGPRSTVLALKAMLAYEKRSPRVLVGGEASIYAPLAQPQMNLPQDAISFSSRSQDPLLFGLRDAHALRPGKNVIRLNATANNTLPYTLTWSYRTGKAVNDPTAPINLTTKLSHADAKEGETIKLTARIENVSGKRQGTTVAILGLPAGFTMGEGASAFAANVANWELRGRELVLLFNEVPQAGKIEINVDLTCRVPGIYRGPASRIYVHMNADQTFWAEPLNVRIVGDK